MKCGCRYARTYPLDVQIEVTTAKTGALPSILDFGCRTEPASRFERLLTRAIVPLLTPLTGYPVRPTRAVRNVAPAQPVDAERVVQSKTLAGQGGVSKA